jgi:hypothetical protein
MEQVNPIMVPYHIAPMDMYVITAFGTDGTREYPTDDKIRAYMLLTGFQQFDPRLSEMDRLERDVIEHPFTGEYRQIEDRETTRGQLIQKGVGNISAATGIISLGAIWFFPPLGAGLLVGGFGSLSVSGISHSAGDPHHNIEKNTGVSYMNDPRLDRLREKVLKLEESINHIGVDTNVAVLQQKQAQHHFNNVIQTYQQNNNGI